MSIADSSQLFIAGKYLPTSIQENRSMPGSEYRLALVDDRRLSRINLLALMRQDWFNRRVLVEIPPDGYNKDQGR